jgi:hypothetical protein
MPERVHSSEGLGVTFVAAFAKSNQDSDWFFDCRPFRRQLIYPLDLAGDPGRLNEEPELRWMYVPKVACNRDGEPGGT